MTMLSSGSTRYQTPMGNPVRGRDARAGDDLILEGVCGDPIQCGANLKNESIAEALLGRFVVVLRALDVRFRERSDANQAAQRAG